MLLDGGSSRYQVYDPIALIVQVAQEVGIIAAVLRARGSCSRMIPFWVISSCSITFFNSCSGVMFSQSAAQRSAPKTRMPRDCRRSSAAGVESK